MGDTMLRDEGTIYPDKSQIPKYSYLLSCFPLTPQGAFSQAGTDLINTKTFYLSDLSCTGLPRVDGMAMYVPFEQAQKLCGMAGSVKRVSRIHIKFAKGMKINKGCELVRSLWDKYSRERQDESQAFLLIAGGF